MCESARPGKARRNKVTCGVSNPEVELDGILVGFSAAFAIDPSLWASSPRYKFAECRAMSLEYVGPAARRNMPAGMLDVFGCSARRGERW